MILRMMQCAIEFVDAPTNAGFEENVLDIFQQSIADQKQNEEKSYEDFQQRHKDPRDTKGSEEHIKALCDITGELNALLEIKDIVHELEMIERVFHQQDGVVGQYQHKEGLSSPELAVLKSLQKNLKDRRERVKGLRKEAESVKRSFNNLLDMKQKQGNLRIVEDTHRRALEGEWQTKLLSVFTIVTVIFTPISFVCGLLAVPIRDFPDNGGNDVAWRWWQVFVAALVTELIIPISIGIYWRWQDVKKRSARTTNATEQNDSSTQPTTESSTSRGISQRGPFQQELGRRKIQETRGNDDIV